MKKLTYFFSLLAIVMVFSSFSDNVMGKKEKKEKAKTEKVKSTKKKKIKGQKKFIVEDTVSNPVWVFGFSASFTDSIIYMTDIQRIPDAKITKKTKFLSDASDFSSQLKYYLETEQNMKNRTCVVFHDAKKANIEKKYVEIRKRYADQTHLILKYLNSNDFQFIKSDKDE